MVSQYSFDCKGVNENTSDLKYHEK